MMRKVMNYFWDGEDRGLWLTQSRSMEEVKRFCRWDHDHMYCFSVVPSISDLLDTTQTKTMKVIGDFRMCRKCFVGAVSFSRVHWP